MRLTTGARAPYPPGSVVVDLVRRHREAGVLRGTVDPSLLERLGVSEALRPRTLAGLRGLSLIDADDKATDTLDSFKAGSEAEFKERAAAWVTEVYGEVFDVLGDLNKITYENVDDAFRAFVPSGQRQRMVSLFLALCVEFGLLSEVLKPSATKKSSSGKSAGSRVRAKVAAITSPTLQPDRVLAGVREQEARNEVARIPAAVSLDEPEVVTLPTLATTSAPAGLDPLIAAWVGKLPPAGSPVSEAKREKYLSALRSIFDLTYEDDDADHQARPSQPGGASE